MSKIMHITTKYQRNSKQVAKNPIKKKAVGYSKGYWIKSNQSRYLNGIKIQYRWDAYIICKGSKYIWFCEVILADKDH